MDKKNKDYIKLAFIIIAILWVFSGDPFFDKDEYDRCVDSCVYDNEFCGDDSSIYLSGVWFLSINSYDECHYDLEYCLSDCD